MTTVRRYLMGKGAIVAILMALTSAVFIIAACGGKSTSAAEGPAATSTPGGSAATLPAANANNQTQLPEPTASGAGNTNVPLAGKGTAGTGEAFGQASGSGVRAPASDVASIQFNTTQQVGIWVSGRSEAAAPPDIAILSAGVEARAETVASARAQAAQAMDDLMQVLKARGIEDKDIQTRSFNIFPEYVFNESRRRQELVGFRVSNQVAVKIRNIDIVGPVIDEVAAAAGDLVRIQGVSFSIEDTKSLEIQARAAAVKDLMSKAQQLADLTGVKLGKPVFLSESGGGAPRIDTTFQAKAAFAEAAAPPTAISGGELQMIVTIQGVYTMIGE